MEHDGTHGFGELQLRVSRVLLQHNFGSGGHFFLPARARRENFPLGPKFDVNSLVYTQRQEALIHFSVKSCKFMRY